jgi:hypothetical protein
MLVRPKCIPRSSFVLSLLVVGAAAGVGCGGSSPPAPTSTAAAVAGPVDVHCTDNGVEIKQAIGTCVVDNGTTTPSADDGGADGATSDDGGTNDGGSGVVDVGPPMYNAEGDDDDCKYHVTWTSTAVKENAGVTFDVNIMRRMDGMPATGANVQIEAYLNTHHPTPSTDVPNSESAGGNYRIGPVVFDAPGMWTVRFHFYETCSDEPEDSPHGHAAFFVDVP